jgi:hypothetical protein
MNEIYGPALSNLWLLSHLNQAATRIKGIAFMIAVGNVTSGSSTLTLQTSSRGRTGPELGSCRNSYLDAESCSFATTVG